VDGTAGLTQMVLLLFCFILYFFNAVRVTAKSQWAFAYDILIIPYSLSLSLPSPGGDGLALVSSWGEAIGVCHCPDYHHSWGALSDPGVLSLSPTCPLSLSLFLSLSVCHLESEPWGRCVRSLLRTMPSSRCAMYSCQPNHRWKQ
jgi:hypothetical protein